MHSVCKLFNIIPNATFNVVLPQNKINYWKNICNKHKIQVPHKVFIGGETRFSSVKKTICSLPFEGNDLLIVHDAARPFFSKKLINKLIESAKKKGHAVPAIEIKDSLRKKKGNTTISVNRSEFLLTQTPQVFKADIISKAYSTKSHKISKTDDVSLIEDIVFPINLIYGEELNFKITNPKDWALAKIIAPTIL